MATKLIATTALVIALASTSTEARAFSTAPHHPRTRLTQQKHKIVDVDATQTRRFIPKRPLRPVAVPAQLLEEEEEEQAFKDTGVRCMAMTPSCMGQAAYDAYINRLYEEEQEEQQQLSLKQPIVARCKAMTPSCMGQAAYDAYINRRFQMLSEEEAEEGEEKIVVGQPRCRALTPSCMGQAAFDAYINRRFAQEKQILEEETAPKPTFQMMCRAITPQCLGQEAYDAYMARYRATQALEQSLEEELFDELFEEEQLSIKQPIVARCMALTPQCMGLEAWERYMQQAKAVVLEEDEEEQKSLLPQKFWRQQPQQRKDFISKW